MEGNRITNKINRLKELWENFEELRSIIPTLLLIGRS